MPTPNWPLTITLIAAACSDPSTDPSDDAQSTGMATAPASTAGTTDSATPSSTGTAPTPEDDSTDDSDDPTASSSGGSETGSETDTDDPVDIPAECVDSVLADLVQTMEPRSWAVMPDNDSLDALEMSYALLYWSDSAVFDEGTRQLHWVGGPGSCCADPPTYQRISYNELDDAWSIEATPFVGSGHAYDGNAFEPGTTNHYFAKFSDPAVRVFDGDSWDQLPDLPIYAPATMGLTWFPEQGGLVYVGAAGEAASFDGSAWTEILGADGAPWGSYNTFSEYSAQHGLVWMGGGNGANAINYTLDATGTLTRQPDAPVNLGNGQGLHTSDPGGGNFLTYNSDLAQLWELDPIGQAWAEVDTEPPPFQGSVFQVPLPHCGVVLFFDHYWENRTIHLYRHG